MFAYIILFVIKEKSHPLENIRSFYLLFMRDSPNGKSESRLKQLHVHVHMEVVVDILW